METLHTCSALEHALHGMPRCDFPFTTLPSLHCCTMFVTCPGSIAERLYHNTHSVCCVPIISPVPHALTHVFVRKTQLRRIRCCACRQLEQCQPRPQLVPPSQRMCWRHSSTLLRISSVARCCRTPGVQLRVVAVVCLRAVCSCVVHWLDFQALCV